MAAHEPPPLVTPSRHDPRIMLMAGVAGACLLGAAAGAWVKPEARDLKRREAPQVSQRLAATGEPEMQIVLDDMSLPPATTPLEVLPDRPPVLVKAVAAKPRAEEPKPKTPAPAKPPKAKPAKKVEKIVVAKAEPKAPKPAKAAPAKKAKPVLMAKADPKPKPVPKAEKPKPAPKPVVQAKAEPKPVVAPPPPKKTLAKAVTPPAPAESTWAAEDRRLARAYRQALEAGAPEWRLARQQARWRSIRDEAMREAPWALSDIYVARIAELDDEAGEAAMQLD